jgi:pimeloyl-ACP methyl ester carboxylesterase
MHNIELNGCGPPLLMVHGWGQNHRSLVPLGQLLTPFAKPYLIDLPGFGQSPCPDQVWSAYDYADSIVHLLKEKNVMKFSVLGHSFGGKVSLGIALRYPERVESLILIAPSGLKPKRSTFDRLKLKTIVASGKCIKAYDGLFGTNHFANVFAKKFGSRDYQNAGSMRAVMVKSVNEDYTNILPNIACKTLILWGEKDAETPLEAGSRFAKLMPSAQFYSFPYHDHEIFKDAGAHLCATYIAPFLKENTR